MDINEDSLDLYTDLISEDYSNQPSKTSSTESQQQLTEVLDNAKATIHSLNVELQEKAKKEAELQKRIEILEKNNSSLLLTAKSELGRKNSVISDLRDQIDEHTKSRFYNGKFNKFPDKNHIYISRKSDNRVSPDKNSRKRKNSETDDERDSKRCRNTRSSRSSVIRNDSESESKTDKLIGNRSPKSKSSDIPSEIIKTCVMTKSAEMFDLRDKLKNRKLSGKESSQRLNIDSKSSAKTNYREDEPSSSESQYKGRTSKSDTDGKKLPVPVKAVDDDGHAKLSEKETKLQKSTLMKHNTKCSIMEVVNKLSKASENKPNFVIPKLSTKRSFCEEDQTLDNGVLDNSMSAESSDETEKLIVDLNSTSDLEGLPFNSQLNSTSGGKCSVNQTETINQVEKKQTSESDSDFASKLQLCVDMLSDSDPNETCNTHQLETSTNNVHKVNDTEPYNSKHDVIGKVKNSSSVKDLNERELMSPPKSLPKKKKCENKNLSDSLSQKSAYTNLDVAEKVASNSSSNTLTDNCSNLVQTQSVVNRILDLSKSVALNSHTREATHRSPVVNSQTHDILHNPQIVNSKAHDVTQRLPLLNSQIVNSQTQDVIHNPQIVNSQAHDVTQRLPLLNSQTQDVIHNPKIVNSQSHDAIHNPQTVNSKTHDAIHHPQTVNSKTHDGIHNPLIVNSQTHDTIRNPKIVNSHIHNVTQRPVIVNSHNVTHRSPVKNSQNYNATERSPDENSQTHNVTRSQIVNSHFHNATQRSPVNNYEEPKHNSISYFTWKIPQLFTFSNNNPHPCKYREQNMVFGIQDVPLSDPRTIVQLTIAAAMHTSKNVKSKDLDKKVNDLASEEKQSKDNKKKRSRSKDREKSSTTTTDKKDNDDVKVRSNHKSPVRDKTTSKTSGSEISSKEGNVHQEPTIISMSADKELLSTDNDLNKPVKKTSTKKPSKSKSVEKSPKTKPLTRKSAKSKHTKEKVAVDKEEKKNDKTERNHSNRASSVLPTTSAETDPNTIVHRLKDRPETDVPPTPKPHFPLVDTPITNAESHSIELATPESVTKPKESSEIVSQIKPMENIEVKLEPYSDPAPSTLSGLNAFPGMFISNLTASNNETEFLKRLNRIEEEIHMLKSAALQSLQTKVIAKTENVFTESQNVLGTGTNDNPIMISSSNDVTTEPSQSTVSGSDAAVSESGNAVENQSNISDKSSSEHTSSDNVSKNVDSLLSPHKPSNISNCVTKTVPIQKDADSSSGHCASQTHPSDHVTKVSMNSNEDSNSSHNSSFSVHSAESSVSSSFETNNVRNSFTKHETLVTCNNSDTEDSLTESSEDDLEIETVSHCNKEKNLNPKAAEVLKSDLDMSSDSEDACKDNSDLLPQKIETPNDLNKNLKTPIQQDLQSPWNRISPVPKFVSPENVNCDSKLLALVNLATLDLHLSGHEVPFENKARSSKNENNSHASPEVVSSTPCSRKTRSQGKSVKNCVPEVIESNTVKIDKPQKISDSDSCNLPPVISSSSYKRNTSKDYSTESRDDTFPVISYDNPKSPEADIEMPEVTDGLKTLPEEPPAELQISQDVKRSPNIEDFKIFQSVENDGVEDIAEPVTDKEDGEITQDSIINTNNHKQLTNNSDSVYFLIDTKVDENDELFKCSDAENSLSEKPTKKLQTPKKRQLCSVKTRSSPRIRDKSVRARLGVRDRTERRASDVTNSRKRSRRPPSPGLNRSNGRRRLYENNNNQSDNKSDSKPLRKPYTDSARDRDRDNERVRSTRRSSRDRSDRYKSRNCRSRS